MNEKIGTGIVIAFIALVSLAGAFLDSPHGSRPPVRGGEGPQTVTPYRQQSQTAPLQNSLRGNDVSHPDIDPETTCYENELPAACDSRIVQHKIEKFTLYLVGVGVLQVVVAFFMWRVYRRQTDIMDNQAYISEQGLIIGKQPQIFLRTSTVSYREIAGPFERRLRCVCEIEAVGETPATIVLAELELRLGRSPDSGSTFIAGQGLPNTRTIKSAETFDLGYSDIRMNDGLIREIGLDASGNLVSSTASHDRYFFMSGRVIFEDVFGHQHEYGFCRRVNRSGGSGHVYGGNNRNYRRERKPGEQFWSDGMTQRWDG